ncbi:MAG: proteasome accessory factor PafA2 family protein, partial [Verrucomicrobiota bacterium]|nr:proteasome accessory factor PafA2 family protein [Verrucomicrobiota bacterium]
GQANPLAFDFEVPAAEEAVDFQLSQRADHIVNDIYQWVQFNRAIINARDEPLADYRKYRRLHLLIGDSNMSPFANALKIGTTACILTLLEAGLLPNDLTLLDAVQATRDVSRDSTQRWLVELEDGRTIGALDVQWRLHALATKHLAGTDEETDWLLESWRYTLDALPHKPEALLGGVDWISKKWLLDTFRTTENLGWSDPWLQSLDLEYHNIDPNRGLFFGLQPAKRIGEWNNLVRQKDVTRIPPADTRANGRAQAVAAFRKANRPYVINWDSIACETHDCLVMGDPFKTYVDEVDEFVREKREPQM